MAINGLPARQVGGGQATSSAINAAAPQSPQFPLGTYRIKGGIYSIQDPRDYFGSRQLDITIQKTADGEFQVQVLGQTIPVRATQEKYWGHDSQVLNGGFGFTGFDRNWVRLRLEDTREGGVFSAEIFTDKLFKSGPIPFSKLAAAQSP